MESIASPEKMDSFNLFFLLFFCWFSVLYLARINQSRYLLHHSFRHLAQSFACLLLAWQIPFSHSTNRVRFLSSTRNWPNTADAFLKPLSPSLPPNIPPIPGRSETGLAPIARRSKFWRFIAVSDMITGGDWFLWVDWTKETANEKTAGRNEN